MYVYRQRYSIRDLFKRNYLNLQVNVICFLFKDAQYNIWTDYTQACTFLCQEQALFIIVKNNICADIVVSYDHRVKYFRHLR